MKFTWLGVILVLACGLLAGCSGSSSSSVPAATVSQGSPHYQTDVALCGDNPANMDWGTVQAKLGGATPALANLVSAWYGDYGTQQTMQVTGDTSGVQSMTPKVVVDGVVVAVWCRKNVAGWSSP